MSTKSTKGVRKLERPRPLRSSSDSDRSPSSLLSPAESVTMLLDTNAQCSVNDEDVLNEIETLHVSLNNGNYDATILSLIANVCELLKVKGAAMESSFKDQLDCYFVTLRNASRDERLDVIGRLRLLEVIELRASGWKSIDLIDYFKCKFAEFEPQPYQQQQQHQQQQQPQQTQQQHSMAPVTPATSPPLSLQPTEVLKSSGKFGKPAKIPGRNFLKDEIVIRNSDSGKVNPGVRDRLVQITGPSEETITRAKELIEDTIRRNASPVREMGDETANSYGMGAKESCQKPSLVHSYSMGDASVGEYTTTASVGRDTLRISGHKAVLVKAAKMFLEKYLLNHGDLSEKVAADMLSASNQGSYMSPEANMLSNNRGVSELCTEAASWQGLAVRRDSGPPSSHTSSSSDEETYKEDGVQEFSESDIQRMAKCTGDPSDSVTRFTLEKEMNMTPKHVSRSGSILKNLPAQIATRTSSVAEVSGQPTKQFKRSGSSPEFSAKADRPQVPSSASLDASDAPIDPAAVRKCYSRDALLHMSVSPLATQMPPDFPSLDPEVANLMVKQHITPFDSDGFRQRMMRQASVSDFVSSSPVSSTPPRSDVSEVEDSAVA
ncbi:eukaryotic translation initiation factor 4E-binding protein Mextli isoform X2 [Rhipicephalus sanguineus]|uniref:eukaryotic translation initiation factor 4E-binding protein Mextli isoform X2 n=1 Tax=Rhipicephalus sanguineus TaxID=34632 RepID=UPI0018957A23|nr:eukaryotic translation initiation factor 4E-binding protein Mextli isoform X2 [Rhipicephalus sanguineus]